MVEGHGVHRVAAAHRRELVGKRFAATSPNGRFAEGAAVIASKLLVDVQAIGKNLFYSFAGDKAEKVVMHGASCTLSTAPRPRSQTCDSALWHERALQHPRPSRAGGDVHHASSPGEPRRRGYALRDDC